jgi:hypothetical protein
MSATPEAGRERVLLTLVSTGPKPTIYALNAREVDSDLASVAFPRLLPDGQRDDRVLALFAPEITSIQLEQSLLGPDRRAALARRGEG